MNLLLQQYNLPGLALSAWQGNPLSVLLAFVLGAVVGELTWRWSSDFPLTMLKGWHVEALSLLGLSAEQYPLEKLEAYSQWFPTSRPSARFNKFRVFMWGLCGALMAITAARFCLAHFGWVSWCWVILTLVLAGVDVKSKLLPDVLVYILLWSGLLFNTLPVSTVGLGSAVWGAFAAYAGLWLFYHLFKLLTGKEGMGFGDFKLLAAFGAWFGANAILPILVLSCVVGSVVGIIGLATKVLTRDNPIPFGPYLAGAGWVWMIVAWTP